MNKENLKIVLDNYTEKIDYIYDSENDELYKWRALKVFKDNWNVNAKDFYDMMKKATKEMYNLVDNRIVQPLSGLIKMAEFEPETVRAMFKKLEIANSLSVEERQDAINEFKRDSEELINKYYKGSWKYAQSTRDIIFYLNMIEPSKNYIYKYSVSKKMSDCIEFGDGIGSGDDFKLRTYYKMCDEIKDFVKENIEFLKLHKSYLNDLCYTDESLNILIYDIIYCADTYNLYGDIVIKKTVKSTKQERKLEIKNKLESLYTEKSKAKKGLLEIDEIIANLEEINVINEVIEHNKFGKGKIIEQNNKSIMVEFDSKDIRKFSVPIAFSKGFLKTQNENIIEKCIELEKLETEREEFMRKLQRLDVDIEILEKQL